MNKYYFHLPGLYEFYEFYKAFLSFFKEHKEYFYDGAEIGSVYGSPDDAIWSGGRIENSNTKTEEVLELLEKYGISARLAFSNLLIEEKHLKDEKCNGVCTLFNDSNSPKNGVIIASDTLLKYLKMKYTNLYFVSSTTKVLTDFNDFKKELDSDDYEYVVPDYRLNKKLDKLKTLNEREKVKTEFLLNECCPTGCKERKECYMNVSHKILSESYPDHKCTSMDAESGYRFSEAMKNPAFISREDIKNIYLPMGFTNFKIEGRSLGSAVVFEMILYYMVKPEYQLKAREEIYLDSNLDLF